MAAPVIATVPTISFTKGVAANISVASYITDADGDPTTAAYTGSGLPAGVVFNASQKRYEYDGTGSLSTTIATNSNQFSATDVSVAATEFAFAEIPEIVFIRGFAETEQLGPFQLDTGNRWTPGDLTRTSGWTARNTPTLVVDSGTQPANLTYNTSTGVLTYSAGETSATADLTLTCHLRCTSPSTINSDSFRIRILSPTHIWGTGAATYTAKTGWNTTPQRFTGVWGGTGNLSQALPTSSTDSAPSVVLCLGGTYDNTADGVDYFFLGNDRNFLYLLGDPSNKPTWKNDRSWSWITRTSNKDAIFYLKNMTWSGMSLSPGANDPEQTTKFYVTKVLFRDPNGGSDVFGYSNQEWDSAQGVFTGNRISHVFSCEFFDAGGTSVTHMIYAHGRPGSEFYANNLIMRGGNDCQQLKGTIPIAKFRNSFFCAVLHPPSVPAASAIPTLNDMTVGARANNLIDWVNCSDTVVFNCHFIGAFQQGTGATSLNNGTQDGLIFMRARREIHGSDVPAYPQTVTPGVPMTQAEATADYDAGVTDCLNSATGKPGYFSDDVRFTWLGAFITDGGPATFKSTAFWTAVAAAQADLTSYAQAVASPYTFKHFVSFCTFEWLVGGVAISGYAEAVRNDGTYPRRPISQFSSGSVFERAPSNWRERTMDFYCNNFFTGWATNTEAFVLRYDASEAVGAIESEAQWPRTQAYQYPQYYITANSHGYGTQVTPQPLPSGFEI